jgi:SAM-dependent methyltransferase
MKLRDYYREVVEINDSMKGGWAKTYYGIFSLIIQENTYTNVAEIGIGYGTHAKYILKTTNVKTLHLIDPMTYYENDGFASDVMKQEADISGNNFNEMYALIQEELSPWSHRTKFYRVPSLGVTNEMIADESLDCIFLDGDHSYGAVYSDLQFWWKKLRSGGQLLGDDWWMQDVQRAVYDFANQNGLHFEFLEKEGEGYKIFQFKKV